MVLHLYIHRTHSSCVCRVFGVLYNWYGWSLSPVGLGLVHLCVSNLPPISKCRFILLRGGERCRARVVHDMCFRSAFTVTFTTTRHRRRMFSVYIWVAQATTVSQATTAIIAIQRKGSAKTRVRCRPRQQCFTTDSRNPSSSAWCCHSSSPGVIIIKNRITLTFIQAIYIYLHLPHVNSISHYLGQSYLISVLSYSVIRLWLDNNYYY